jgi:hypothetical protein
MTLKGVLRHALCKAQAAVLLRFRHKRVPTLAELSQLTAMDTCALPIAAKSLWPWAAV